MAVYDILQPVFNKVWQEFVVNKRGRAWSKGGGMCVYRGDSADHAAYDPASDVRCAIGVLIPDNMYDDNIESHGIVGVHELMPDWYESMFNGLDAHVLNELQAIHDMEFSTFEVSMIEFANRHGLTIPVSVTSDAE